MGTSALLIIRRAELADAAAIADIYNEGSQESIHLNESTGFELVGTLKQVGSKFGKRLDVHVMQKMLG